MKKHEVSISNCNIYDPVLEEMMQKRDAEIKETARRNAKHFAKRNLPAPTGGNISHLTGEVRAGYEKLASDVNFHLQPSAHLPEAKMDAEYYREKFYVPWHKKFLDALTKEPVLLHIDLHNTDETKYCLSAYTPGNPLRMQDFTDFDIANRSAYKNANEPIDKTGVTFPGDEMDLVINSAKKHFKELTSDPKITVSSFMRGGAIIQIARDKGNWVNGIPRSLQFEIQRQYFAKPKELAKAIQGIIEDLVSHLN